MQRQRKWKRLFNRRFRELGERVERLRDWTRKTVRELWKVHGQNTVTW